MRKILRLWILLFSGLTLMMGCVHQAGTAESENMEEKDTQTIQAFEFMYNRFKRVSGWLTDRSILVHIDTLRNEKLVSYDIYSTKRHVVFDAPGDIVSVQLSDNSQYIAVQYIIDEKSVVVIIDTEGQKIQEMTIDTTNVISFQWNPEIEHKLFASYPQFSEKGSRSVIISWDASVNEVKRFEGNTLNPTWYSMHTYLYIKPKNVQRSSEGALYYGDIVTEHDLLINSRIGHFFLNEDTFVAMTTSDFNKDEIFLTREYPLMVDGGYVTLPKATSKDEVIYPFLTQGNRNGMIYAIIPKARVSVGERAGEYEIAVLDFETNAIKSIMDVPAYAPIDISKNNRYLLYGWHYEDIIDLQQREIYSFLKDEK